MEHAALLLGRKADLASLGAPFGAGAGFEVHGLEWAEIPMESLSTRPETVIVAISAPDDPRSVQFFARLAAGGIRRIVLAIVRAEDHDAMASATAHADDFALWPVDALELEHRLRRLMNIAPRLRESCERLEEESALAQLVGSAGPFVSAIRRIPPFARSGMPVLIIGETGTGKELCARALHFLSARRSEPFVAVDCSAIPDHLFENELFGHLRGAYTDAHAEQKGLAALAGRGTLFLDEVDSLAHPAQGKLLRFLQEKTFKPLGGEKFLFSHATVLAATNRELDDAVRTRQFRSDLYYRLNVLQLRLPPLRERREDIALLARHFLAAAGAGGQVDRRFSPQALRKLESHDWPGNVRELWNLVQRAAVSAEDGVVLPCHIETPGPPEICAESTCDTFRAARGRAIQAFERTYVHDVLTRNGGNISRAARAAGQERRAFGRLVKKYELMSGRLR